MDNNGLSLETSRIVICIPAHGYSPALFQAIKALSIDVARSGWEKRVTLLLSNSGSEINDTLPWAGKKQIITIPNSYYWGAAVHSLFTHATMQDATHVLLMNHDVIPLEGAFSELLNIASQYPQSIISSVSLIKGTEKVEVAGFLVNKHIRPVALFFNAHFKELPDKPFAVDALNGRFVLFPIQAANPKFLFPKLVPHYYADTVLSTLARRKGFRLIIAPNALVLSDQSDQESKNQRQRCDSFNGLMKALFKPYSTRYLPGGFWGQLLLVDNLIVGVLLAFYFTFMRTIKACLEYIGILPKL